MHIVAAPICPCLLVPMIQSQRLSLTFPIMAEKRMEAQGKRLKPKLERRNAMKNIDYQVPPSSPSFDLSPALLEQTSFRVKGIDGEFDLILRNLGLSGPEDFAIPTAAWEAQKVRLASPVAAPRPLLEQQIDTHFGLKNHSFQAKDRRLDASSDSNKDGDGDGDGAGAGGGIKGVRPPVLAPPPAMLRSLVVDEVSSTWDLMRSFAPKDEGVVEENEDLDDCREELNGVRQGEGNLGSDSSSYTSASHDDDSDAGAGGGGGSSEKASGIVDYFIHNVSPHGSFRRTFLSWQKGEILGKGSFGAVYEGFTDDGFFFAVKEVSLLDDGSIFQLQQEISLLSQFEHENIVRYLGTDKDENMLYIFLELVTKGSLASLYQKYHLRDSQVSSYTRQILSGLKYLHDRNVVHRDIKCANILVDANGSVKLADFGLAKATKLNDVKSSKGSPYWMAPEVVNLRNRGYGLAADIWSLGCTVLEMLTRQPPYSHLEGLQALFRIGRGIPPPVPESLSKDARDFILKCLQVNPNKRSTAAELLEHPFVKRPLLSPISPVSPLINHLLS